MAEIKKNLLTMTQDIMLATNLDSVNSINDTLESEQIAKIIVGTYFDLIATRKLPEHRELDQLEGLSDSLYPNYLKLPDDVSKLVNDYFFYDVSDTGEALSYGEVHWVEPEIFLERQRHLNPDNTNVSSITDFTSSTTLRIFNDLHPTYFTSFDDYYIVCNSYDSSIDTTLQTSKTQAFVVKSPVFAVTDAAIPDIDPEYFPYLEAEARSRTFAWVTKTLDQKAEQIARRHKINTQNDLWRIGEKETKRDYGRS